MNKGNYVTSWLAVENDDEKYEGKHAIIITYGQGGYHKTDWILTREQIIERNKDSGITEEDRKTAECLAIQISAITPQWQHKQERYTKVVDQRLGWRSKKELRDIIAELLFADDWDIQRDKLKDDIIDNSKNFRFVEFG